MDVEIVAVEREFWSGEATFVFTRTTAGEIGILPRHIPLVAQLVDDAMVRVEREGEDDLRIAVDGGFLSVTDEALRILVESAEFESEINADEAKRTPSPDDRATAAWGARVARPRPDRLGAADERVHAVHGRAGRRAARCRSSHCATDCGSLRQVGGSAAILRDIPAVGGHGWRHGVMRYRGGEAGFYRLSSLRWWPDRRLSRRGLEVVSRRARAATSSTS